MSRSTFVLALAGALVAAPVLGAQPPQQPPAGQPPAGAPAGAPAPRRPMMGGRGFAPGGPGQGAMGRRMAGGPMGRGAMGRGAMGRGAMGIGPDAAEMLLARTGDLKLTDQQVTRLAAIARRAHERRETMRTTMRARLDSLRAANPPAAGAAPGTPGTPGARRFMPGAPGAAGARNGFAADMQRMRDQAHADLRDAIAVLTPDQQAQAWEAVSARGAAGRPGRGFQRGGPAAGPGRGFQRGVQRGGQRGGPMPRRAPEDDGGDR